MACGTKCLKVMLVIVNILFFLAGAAVLGGGLWVRFDESLLKFKGENTGLQEFRDGLYLAAYVLIAFGAFTFVVGFAGCCGAMRESKCLLGVYILLVTIVLGAEIGGGVYGYINKDSLLKKFDDMATKYIKDDYGNGNNNGGDEAWNSIMQFVKCCGVHGVADFKGSTWQKKGNVSATARQVPDSCCVLKDDNMPVDLIQCQAEAFKNVTKVTASLYGIGCRNKVESLITDNSTILLGVGAGVAGFELIVVIMAIAFCCNMKEDD